MPLEHFKVYDQKGMPTGKIAPRGEPLQIGEYFPVVHVWLENEEGKYLIQQRAKASDVTPYQWATVSGLVLHNEEPLHAAIRETAEELGITLNPHQCTLKKTIQTIQSKYQTITYVYHASIVTQSIKVTLDYAEVKSVQYMTLNEIFTLIANNRFWDYPKLLNDDQYFSILEKK